MTSRPQSATRIDKLMPNTALYRTGRKGRRGISRMADTATHAQAGAGETRRDFLYLAAAGMGAVGTACVVWPLIDTMNPSAEVLALASTEVDLAPIAEGQRVTEIGRARV